MNDRKRGCECHIVLQETELQLCGRHQLCMQLLIQRKIQRPFLTRHFFKYRISGCHCRILTKARCMIAALVKYLRCELCFRHRLISVRIIQDKARLRCRTLVPHIRRRLVQSLQHFCQCRLDIGLDIVSTLKRITAEIDRKAGKQILDVLCLFTAHGKCAVADRSCHPRLIDRADHAPCRCLRPLTHVIPYRAGLRCIDNGLIPKGKRMKTIIPRNRTTGNLIGCDMGLCQIHENTDD